MNIAIIGAGFTGLSAAYTLIQKGHTVTLFERDKTAGGLALGFQTDKWNWTLEQHYHHWFTNDKAILKLASDIQYPVLIKRPKTSVYLDNQIFQLDSPLHILTFPQLSLVERLRMAGVLAALRFDPFWQPLEQVNAATMLPKLMGKKAYKTIWEPQLVNKFGDYHTDVSLAWFWARIKKRTSSLAYPEGGFLRFAEHLVSFLSNKNATFYFETQVTRIEPKRNKITVHTQKKTKKTVQEFDKVLVTLPSALFDQITPDLPTAYSKKLAKLNGLGAINLVLRLKKEFLPSNTYWLSICQKNAPVMAIVEHTHFMNKKHYNNDHLVYLGNYLPANHPHFSLSAEELLKRFDPFLKQINTDYRKTLIQAHIFKAPFAQPIVPVNYSKMIPSIKTPLQNVYLANMQQVYPWDRGTNYAVEIGEKAAQIMVEDQKA